MSVIFSGLKDFFDLVGNFFSSIFSLLEFLWDLIAQIDDMIIMITEAASNLPLVFTFIPPSILVFASAVIIIAVLYLILGRN